MNAAPTESSLATWRKALQIFHDDAGIPWGPRLTTPQLQVVDLIAGRRAPRSQLIMPTQYGKSMSVAFGVLLRVTNYPEKWAIVAPTTDKAQIIMDYVIDHIFDSPLFSERLEYYETKEKLTQNRSKRHITFRDAGELRVYTGNATNSTATREALMGFGSPNIILDESALIPDDLYSTVHRMLGGSTDNFLLEIGNPFYRNHFYRSWQNPNYHRILVDCNTALAEGRYTQQFIDEAKDQAFFDVLYECKFPDQAEVLPSGYRRLILNAALENATVETAPEAQGKPILGIDIAAGGANETKFVVRWNNYARVVATYTGEDLGEVADIAENLIKTYEIGEYRICIDAGGVGHGLPSILRDRGYMVKAVLFGEKAPEPAFLNTRAWMYWRMRSWLKAQGGKLLADPGFAEVGLIYYRQTSNGKLAIEPKEDMIQRNAKEGVKVASPDTADALALTFVDVSTIVDDYEEGEEETGDAEDILAI